MTEAGEAEARPETAIVIGGGIVGLATAYALGLEGLRVTVLDAGPADLRASTATAGIIGGSSVIPWASSDLWPQLPGHLLSRKGPLRISLPLPRGLLRFVGRSLRAGRPGPFRTSSQGLANLGLRGWAAWQELLAELPQASALFRQNGCLFFYATAEQGEEDKASNEMRRGFGMDLSDLSAAEMRRLLPPLKRPVASGICVNSAAHLLDPLGLQELLKQAVLDQGGTHATACVTGFETAGDRVTAVRADAVQHRADAIVVAAGSGAAALSAELGLQVPMAPAWGASVTFLDPGIELDVPFLVLSDGIAVTPSRQGLRVSGLLQIGGKGKARAMQNSLIEHAKKLFGDFSYSDIAACAGARPLTADSLPLLGPASGFRNLFMNFGHGHWGLTQAAVSGLITADLVGGRTPDIDISAYSPARY